MLILNLYDGILENMNFDLQIVILLKKYISADIPPLIAILYTCVEVTNMNSTNVHPPRTSQSFADYSVTMSGFHITADIHLCELWSCNMEIMTLLF